MNNQDTAIFNQIFSEPIGNLSAKREHEIMKAKQKRTFTIIKALHNGCNKEKETYNKEKAN
jgi:hypothetical protein